MNTTETQSRRSVQRFVSRRRTGHKDKNGKNIYEGDTVEGCFRAPWDDEVLITLEFKVVKAYGGWWCQGIESNHEDDYLKNLKYLRVVKWAPC